MMKKRIALILSLIIILNPSNVKAATGGIHLPSTGGSTNNDDQAEVEEYSDEYYEENDDDYESETTAHTEQVMLCDVELSFSEAREKYNSIAETLNKSDVLLKKYELEKPSSENNEESRCILNGDGKFTDIIVNIKSGNGGKTINSIEISYSEDNINEDDVTAAVVLAMQTLDKDISIMKSIQFATKCELESGVQHENGHLAVTCMDEHIWYIKVVE